MKLSICIPTYNRSAYLRQCLESILISATGFENVIEIVISDNASVDDTSDVAAEYVATYSFVRYHKNKFNVFERNFHVAATLAKGGYIWIFGDDDLMHPEAIAIILKRIEENYNIVICNYPLWSNDFSKVLRERMLPMRTDMIITDHNDLLRIVGLRLGFISMVIIRRDIFLELPSSEYEYYVEYGFSFLYAVYSGIFNQCCAYIETQPVLMQRGGQIDACANKNWWYKCFVIGSSLIFDKLKNKGYSRTAVQRAKYLVLKDDVTRDLIFRKLNRMEISGIYKLLFTYYKSQSYFWIIVIPIIYSPIFLLKLARGFIGIVVMIKMAKKVLVDYKSDSS